MGFDGLVATLGTFGTIAGLIVAVLIFGGAAWLVSSARKGNRRTREARHDPHAGRGPDHRDIKQ